MKSNQAFQEIVFELFDWFWFLKISSLTALISMMRLLLPVPVSIYNWIFKSGIMESINKKKICILYEMLACFAWRRILVSVSWWLLISSWICSTLFWVILNTSFWYVAYSSTLPSDFQSSTMNCLNLFLFEFDYSKRFHCLIWEVGSIWLSITTSLISLNIFYWILQIHIE